MIRDNMNTVQRPRRRKENQRSNQRRRPPGLRYHFRGLHLPHHSGHRHRRETCQSFSFAQTHPRGRRETEGRRVAQ
jgi:hypothetical protein